MAILSRQQFEALQALEWLHSKGQRRTGRSYVLAISCLRRLCRDRRVDVEDHASEGRAHTHLVHMIQQIGEDVGLRIGNISPTLLVLHGDIPPAARAFLFEDIVMDPELFRTPQPVIRGVDKPEPKTVWQHLEDETDSV